jgi:hypothetical protein
MLNAALDSVVVPIRSRRVDGVVVSCLGFRGKIEWMDAVP